MSTKSVALYERFRPVNFDDVVGQPKAVAQIQGILKRGGAGGRAFWISGPSGTGKTTLARIIANTIADQWGVTEYDSADAVNADELDRIAENMQYGGLGRGGRAYIINEAHGLRGSSIRDLLGILERIPTHVVFIFTTTQEGQEGLFEGQADAGPLLSRCFPVALTNQGLAKPFAERALAIARGEGLDGQPLEAYIKLAQKCKNNLRAMIQSVEGGCMIGGVA